MRKPKPKAAKRGRGNLGSNPTKVSEPAPPAGRVLRTNAEIMAEWFFPKFEWPRRLAHYDAVATEILEQHLGDHPRHKAALVIRSLVAAARAALKRGGPVDAFLVATLERHLRESDKLLLVPLAEQAQRFDPSRRAKRPKWDDRLQPLMERVVHDTRFTIQAKALLDALGALAAPNDPKAVIARREALRLYWRPQPDGPEKPLSLSALRTRLTWIKAHLADS
jgi:hypothetical protein